MKNFLKSRLAIILVLLVTSISLLAKDVKLVWDANDPLEEVTHYNLYQKVGTLYTILVTNILSTNVTLTNFPQSKVTFVVTAVNYWGESLYSNEASTPKGNTGPKNLRLLSN